MYYCKSVKPIMSMVNISKRMRYKNHFSCGNYCSKVRNYSQTQNKTFSGVVDHFNGITIDLTQKSDVQESFIKVLEDSLSHWSKEKIRCVWFRISIDNSECVPILAKNGFQFHHARNNYVMMYKWISPHSTPNLPPAAHTNIGVGALVLNNKQQILSVSEKYYIHSHWKLPGGYVEMGENIIDAAVREVKEETGVDCEFESLVTFRHIHKMMFDNSDIYIIMRMSALTEQIQINREIKECKWMDIEEFLNHPNVHEWNKNILRMAFGHINKNTRLNFKYFTVKFGPNTREMRLLILEDL